MIKRLKFVAIFLPVLALLFVWKYGVNIVFWDEFGMVSLFRDSTNFWQFIMQPHNEHFMPLGKLEYYALGKLTSMNSKACMLTSVLVLSLPYLLIIRKIETKSLLPAITSVILFFVAFFSPLSSDNLLWGFQIMFISAYSFGVLAILLCDLFLQDLASQKGGTKYLALASCCCAIASLNSSHGILSWLSVFSVMLYSRQYKRCFVALIPCFLIVSYYLYERAAVGFQTAHGEMSFSAMARYFFSFISSGMWGFRKDAGMIAGIAAVAVICYLIFCRKLYKNYLVTTLAVFGVMLAALVTFGRWRLGLNQAFTSRYFQLQMPLYLALGVAISSSSSSSRGSTPSQRGSLTSCTDFFVFYSAFLLAAVFLIISIDGIKIGIQLRDRAVRSVEIARNFETQPKKDVEKYLFPGYGYAKSQLSLLWEKKLNVFSEKGEP